MTKKFFKSLTIASLLTFSLTASAFAASVGGATVNVSALNLRSQPSTDSPIITTVPMNSMVVLGSLDANWNKVVYRGAVGYMASEYLNCSENIDGDFGFGTIYGNYVRMRSGPSLNASILGTYNHGTRMNVIGVRGNWYKVQYNNVTGYVHSDYFALNGGVADNFSNPKSSSDGQLVVDTAMKYIGAPYVWGGTSPNGFDCSGLVHYVYKELGYTIDRTAASIYQNGVAVDSSDLKPGDVICFSSYPNSIGHVGIYIGEGQFIHASSSARCVTTSECDSYYFKNYFVGARRII